MLTKVSFSMQQGQMASVFDFIPVAEHAAIEAGTSTYDCTTDIENAIAYVDSFQDKEKTLFWPAGWYRLKQIDVTDTRNITFMNGGYVLWIGIGGGENFIFGSTNYDPINPGASTQTNGFKMVGPGHWEMAPASGVSYTYGMRLEHFVSCKFEKVSTGGASYGPASGANRIGCYVQYSYVNEFEQCSFAAAGVPGAGYYSYGVLHGGNNCNVNVYKNCRVSGIAGNPTAARTVGMWINGYGNRVSDCDISAVYFGININSSVGGVFQNNYHEFCTEIITTGPAGVAGTAAGNTFIGGYYEVLQDCVAFRLGINGGSQNTVIIGPYVRGYNTETNQTFVDQVSSGACYGLSIINPNLSDIANPITGTYRGNNGTSISPGILQPNWVTFPATQLASSDPNTLDDYEEGSWTPAITGVTLSTAVGRYIKVGNQVTLFMHLTWPSTADTNSVSITGLPFGSYAPTAEANGLGVGYNESSFNVGGAISATTLYIRKTGVGSSSQPTNADFSGKSLSGTISFVIN